MEHMRRPSSEPILFLLIFYDQSWGKHGANYMILGLIKSQLIENNNRFNFISSSCGIQQYQQNHLCSKTDGVEFLQGRLVKFP